MAHAQHAGSFFWHRAATTAGVDNAYIQKKRQQICAPVPARDDWEPHAKRRRRRKRWGKKKKKKKKKSHKAQEPFCLRHGRGGGKGVLGGKPAAPLRLTRTPAPLAFSTF